MADVLGGGTTNVTLYDEEGVPVGTPAAPLRTDVVDRSARTLGQVAVTSIPEVEVTNDVGNPLSVTATNPFGLESTQTSVLTRLTEIRDRQPGQGAASESTLVSAVTRMTEVRDRLPASGAATETTVAGVRTDLGTDGGAAPTVGTGVRGWLRSLFDRLGDGSQRVVLFNNHGQTANPLVQDSLYKAQARQTDSARVASTGRVSLTLSGNVRAIIVNPATLDNGAANTTSVRIERVDTYASVAGGFLSVLTNVTGGIPTTPRRPKVNPRTLAQTTASVAGQPTIVVGDTNSVAFTGGNDTGIVVALAADAVTTIDVPFTLTPGQNLAVQAAYGKGVDAIITFYWSNVL